MSSASATRTIPASSVSGLPSSRWLVIALQRLGRRSPSGPAPRRCPSSSSRIFGSARKRLKSSWPSRWTAMPMQCVSAPSATTTSASSLASCRSRGTIAGSTPCFVSWRRSFSAMFVTIWMCTQEWSLISRRTTAFTFATCHQPLSCWSALTRSISCASLRLPRSGTRMRIARRPATASAASRARPRPRRGSSIRSSVSRIEPRRRRARVARATARRAARAVGLAAQRRPPARARRSRARSTKYMTVSASATNGAVIAVRDDALEVDAEPVRGATKSRRSTMMPTPRCGSGRRARSSPKTFQPLPRTSSRLRPNDSPAAAALEHDHRDDQAPERQQEEARDDEQDQADRDRDRREEAGDEQRAEVRSRRCANVSPIDMSARPSRTSATASTSAPWSQKTPSERDERAEERAEPAERRTSAASRDDARGSA